MKFFLPESDDLVDPSYDFQNDLYGSDRKLDQRYDVYAHEIFGLPQCDGLLVTKSNISPRIAEQIQNCGGILSICGCLTSILSWEIAEPSNTLHKISLHILVRKFLTIIAIWDLITDSHWITLLLSSVWKLPVCSMITTSIIRLSQSSSTM